MPSKTYDDLERLVEQIDTSLENFSKFCSAHLDVLSSNQADFEKFDSVEQLGMLLFDYATNGEESFVGRLIHNDPKAESIAKSFNIALQNISTYLMSGINEDELDDEVLEILDSLRNMKRDELALSIFDEISHTNELPFSRLMGQI